MKYIEIDFERNVIRVYRPLDISPTKYQPYKIYKINDKRFATIYYSKLQMASLKNRDIHIAWL